MDLRLTYKHFWKEDILGVNLEKLTSTSTKRYVNNKLLTTSYINPKLKS